MKWKIAAVAVIFLVFLAWMLGLFNGSGPKMDVPPPGPAGTEKNSARPLEPPGEVQLSVPAPREEVEDLPPEVLNYGLRLQTGARRVASSASGADYVEYTPQDGISWEKLHQAISEKIIPFEVLAFAEKKKGAFAGGFHVERAGLIMARAIAGELESMGYRVSMRLDDRGQQFQLGPAEKMRGAEGEFLVFGSIEFRLEQRKEGDLQLALAAILCDVEFFGRKPAASGKIKSLHKVHVEDQEKASFPKLEEAADQSRKAAAAVLARAVKKVLSDPGLEGKLVGFVEETGK